IPRLRSGQAPRPRSDVLPANRFRSKYIRQSHRQRPKSVAIGLVSEFHNNNGSPEFDAGRATCAGDPIRGDTERQSPSSEVAAGGAMKLMVQPAEPHAARAPEESQAHSPQFNTGPYLFN